MCPEQWLHVPPPVSLNLLRVRPNLAVYPVGADGASLALAGNIIQEKETPNPNPHSVRKVGLSATKPAPLTKQTYLHGKEGMWLPSKTKNKTCQRADELL